MNVDHLLLVMDTVEEFFNINFDLSLKRKEMELHESLSSSLEEGIVLDLVGEVDGKIVLTYSERFKEFLLGVLLEEFSGLAGSSSLREEALKEFLNQLSGAIVTAADKVNCQWDIGVPHFFSSSDFHRWVEKKLEAVEVPYGDDTIGEMRVRIAMKEKYCWSKEDGR